MAQKAALPFKILERLDVPCGYERSFKMSKGRLLANRYLLGISLKDTTDQVLLEICRELKMPESLFAEFQKNLPEANLVFLGFEDDESDGNYRVYLEYWDKICTEIRSAPQATHPRLMFLGYKWDPSHPNRQGVSSYTCHPMLNTAEINERITSLYSQAKEEQSLRYALDIIRTAAIRCPDRSFIYLEVNEGDNLRASFDLNVYKAALHLHDIDKILSGLRQHYSIRQEEFLKLQQLVAPKRLGHVSGGTNRDGEDFLTLYYEN